MKGGGVGMQGESSFSDTVMKEGMQGEASFSDTVMKGSGWGEVYQAWGITFSDTVTMDG